MRDVTLVILNSLRIKCHIRRPLKATWVFDACSHVTCVKKNELNRFSNHSVKFFYVIRKTKPASM